MGCFDIFSPSPSPMISPPPEKVAAAEVTPERRRKKSRRGLAQRPQDLGLLSLAQGGKLGDNPMTSMFG